MTALAVTSGLLAGLPLPRPLEDGDKDDRGAVLVIGGGAAVPGASLLTGRAALRVGAGKLKIAATPALATALGVAAPEAMIVGAPASARGELSAKAASALASAVDASDAVVIGAGMIDAVGARGLARDLIKRHPTKAWVLDAAALPSTPQAAAFARRAPASLILTPHAGEMAAMLGRPKEGVTQDPLAAARAAARMFRALVVLKGSTTWIVDPDGQAWRHDGGVTGLATSGSGDVLAGVIAGLLARGAPPATAALWGVWLHAQAGSKLSRKIGPLGFLASDVVDVLPGVLARAERKTERTA